MTIETSDEYGKASRGGLLKPPNLIHRTHSPQILIVCVDGCFVVRAGKRNNSGLFPALFQPFKPQHLRVMKHHTATAVDCALATNPQPRLNVQIKMTGTMAGWRV